MELIARLGGACVNCGDRRRLEFDHTAPRTWVAARFSRWTRIKLYERDAAAGHLQLLCRSCNAAKGKVPALYAQRPAELDAGEVAAAFAEAAE